MDLRRGDRIEAGMVIAALERRDAEIALAQAQAAQAQAEAQLANLSEGRREEEIRVIEATLAWRASSSSSRTSTIPSSTPTSSTSRTPTASTRSIPSASPASGAR
jgi:HlyD family secretion protein